MATLNKKKIDIGEFALKLLVTYFMSGQNYYSCLELAFKIDFKSHKQSIL